MTIVFPFSDWIEYIASLIAIISFAIKGAQRLRKDAGIRHVMMNSLILGAVTGSGFVLATSGAFTVQSSGFVLATDSTAGGSPYPSADSITFQFVGLIIGLFAIPVIGFGIMFADQIKTRIESLKPNGTSHFKPN